MSTRRCLTLHGVNVEVWEKSFRVRGASQPIFYGREIGEKELNDIGETILAIKNAARREIREAIGIVE